MSLDPLDRRIVAATAPGLPLVAEPYAEVARGLGIGEATLIERLGALKARGVIRRIGLAPNHYALGLTANGMTVWDLDDEVASGLGRAIGRLDFVSHAYLRPRALPDWPYNLFAMVHGRDRAEVEAKRQTIARILGPAARRGDILYSTRILKKAGFRPVGKGRP